MVYKPLHFLSIYTLLTKEKRFDLFTAGVTVNIHSPKKTLPITYLLANKYSLVFFPQDKRTPGSVYLLVNKYCFGKYLLSLFYIVCLSSAIIAIVLHQSQVCAKLNPNFLRNSQQKQNVKISKNF